jgi:23S rRNA U2552 (ribose-2'-O)-methylase RlmE/FtsJ
MGGSSKKWLNRHVNDHFVKQAQRAGLPSRAAFKLDEIAKKYRLIRPGDIVIDCGAAPGGWSATAQKLVNSKEKIGHVIAIDLLPCVPIPKVHFLQRVRCKLFCESGKHIICECKYPELILTHEDGYFMMNQW